MDIKQLLLIKKDDIVICDDPDMFLFNITSGEIHGFPLY